MKELAELTLKIGDLELRSCNSNLLSSTPHSTANIVRVERDREDKPYCYSLAYWTKGSEGFTLQFVADRPFRYASAEDFWFLAEFGQKFLDKLFDDQE